MFARFIIACLLRFLYVVSGIMQQTIWCLTGQVWNSMIYLIVVVPMDSIKYTTSHPFASYLLSSTINYDYFSTFAIIFARIKKTYHSYSNSFTIFGLLIFFVLAGWLWSWKHYISLARYISRCVCLCMWFLTTCC